MVSTPFNIYIYIWGKPWGRFFEFAAQAEDKAVIGVAGLVYELWAGAAAIRKHAASCVGAACERSKQEAPFVLLNCDALILLVSLLLICFRLLFSLFLYRTS